MKITLIAPSPAKLHGSGVGIRILSACLKREGCDVRIIFLPRDTAGDMYEDKTLSEIAELVSGSELIGISLMTDDLDNVVRITQMLKENSSIPIVWGGIHPTIQPEECLDYADMVCIGEGEEALVELVRKMKDGQDFFNIQGMWFKDKGKIVKNELRPLIQDLDSIPFQDLDYENHYILSDGCIRKINEDLQQIALSTYYFTLTSRGCPHRCTYCWNHTFSRMYPNQPFIRKRSADNVIKELMMVQSRFPFIETIQVADDAFLIRTEREIMDFAEKYKENVVLPLWVTGAHPLHVTRKKLSILVDAGLVDIRMGIQTGSERTKRLYKRHHSNQQVEEAVRTINEFKDKIKLPRYDLILDNPWETEDDLIETLMLLAKLPTPYALSIFPLTLYPATDLYARAKRDGMKTDDPKEVWRIRHFSFKNTYLNRLFLLLDKYARRGDKISTKMMLLLTNRKLRQLRLSWLLYIILDLRPITIQRLKFFLREGLKNIRKGDMSPYILYFRFRSGSPDSFNPQILPESWAAIMKDSARSRPMTST